MMYHSGKKIVLATPLYPPEIGGPATFAEMLVKHFSPEEIILVKFSDVRRLPKLVRHAAYFWRVFLAAKKADAVFALDPVSVGVPAMVAAKLRGKKFLVRIAGDYAWEQGRQRWGVSQELDAFVRTPQKSFFVRFFQRVQTRAAQAADRIIVPSEYFKGIVTAWNPALLQKIEVIYSSVELPPKLEAPTNRRLGFLIVSSGRRVPWKNFDGIERVVKREANWHFSLVENLPRPQALGSVAAADVFVLNSTYEGLSHALIEAMLLGVPIVATNVGGNPELIADGATGLLVPPHDDEALYAALKKVADDPEAARKRAKAAEARARELFSSERALRQLQNLFKKI
ncbi:MAG: glycosyltransferase family 4 protein [Minisyncoccia bacterium]